MVLDIIIGIILLASMALGFWKGFFHTLTHTLGWIIALFCGFIFKDEVKQFLMDHTHIYNTIEESVISKTYNATSEPSSGNSFIPEIFDNVRKSISESIGSAAAESALTVLSFIVIAILVYLIIFIISLLFSKKHNDGAIGFFDGFLGLCLGLVRGIIIVSLLLAVIFPVLATVSPQLSESVMASLDESWFSGYLYNNNFLLNLIDSF